MKETRESKTTITVIAAQPGWYVATLCEGALCFDPILAWEIERKEKSYLPSAGRPGEVCVFRGVKPITLEDNDFDNSSYWAFKRPDGMFEIPYVCTLNDEAAALAYLRGDEQRADAASSPIVNQNEESPS